MVLTLTIDYHFSGRGAKKALISSSMDSRGKAGQNKAGF